MYEVLDVEGPSGRRKVLLKDVVNGSRRAVDVVDFYERYTEGEPMEKNPKRGHENPANVVKTARDERLWREAKQRAKEQGRGGDWNYVMGIFEHMKQRTGSHPYENPRVKNRGAYLRETQRSPLRVEYTDATHATDWSERDAEDVASMFPGAEIENPGELVVVTNPSNPVERAAGVYEMWHQKEPTRASVLGVGCSDGDVMVCVGRAHDIVYRSGKWERGKKTNDYVHNFDTKPKVWMLADTVEGVATRANPAKTVGDLLGGLQGSDNRVAVAELATPLSFSLEGDGDGEEIAIHRGARVYGATDKKTLLIVDPEWGLIVVRGGEMHFDERGIIK